MAAKTYNPSEVVVIFTGPLTGFADGSFVSVERNEDAYSLQIGSDGEGVRSKSSNSSGTVTITLIQSSASNDFLSAIHNADLASDGDGIFPLLIQDLSGTTLVSAETAWIRKHPVVEFDREATSREWVLETDNLLIFAGGN